MPDRSVISVHASTELSERLDRLAKISRRSKSSLAQEAIAGYVETEESFVASVQAGIADADAGRVYSTDEILERASQRYLGKSYSSKTV